MSILIWVILVAAIMGVVLMIIAFANPGGVVSAFKFLLVKPVIAISHSAVHTSRKDVVKKLANMELDAAQDVAAGDKTTINHLFSNADLRQGFPLLEDVQSDKTGIKVIIDRVSPFQTRSSISRKKGEKASYWLLLTRNDFTRKMTATEDIKKGDKLLVTFEIL
jgi:hypothetical protein